MLRGTDRNGLGRLRVGLGMGWSALCGSEVADWPVERIDKWGHSPSPQWTGEPARDRSCVVIARVCGW
jgi:hypothetical protein